MVPGITDSKEYILSLKDYLKKINNIERIDLLPYHTMGVDKYKKLGIKYPLEGVPPMDKQRVDELYKLLKEE